MLRGLNYEVCRKIYCGSEASFWATAIAIPVVFVPTPKGQFPAPKRLKNLELKRKST
jgi:hypothetical protein